MNKKRLYNLIEWVKTQHGAQTRKYTGLPYWTHLQNVANIVSAHVNDSHAVEIAWCHDLLEDTPITYSDLFDKLMSLGYKHIDASFIATRVDDLTDIYTKEAFPQYNREQRKNMEARRISGIPSTSQSIKLADIIDNTTDISQNDPAFAKIYIQEAITLIGVLRKADTNLIIEACYSIKQAQIKLDNQKNTQTKGA